MYDLSYLESKYKNKYKIEYIEEKLDKLLKSYDTSIDKILCIFNYYSLLHCYSMKLYSKRKSQKIKTVLEEKEDEE